MVGEEIHVGVAVVGEVVERGMAEEGGLALSFGLEGYARNEVDHCCLIWEDHDCADTVVHVGC